MSLLIHVAVPLATIKEVQAMIERCCAETADEIIGRRVYEEVGEVLIVIALSCEPHLNDHIRRLNHALHKRLILSFQLESTYLVHVQYPPDISLQEIMHEFPLQPNESWFPSLSDPSSAYICTHTILMKPDQAAWLEHHRLSYQYL